MWSSHTHRDSSLLCCFSLWVHREGAETLSPLRHGYSKTESNLEKRWPAKRWSIHSSSFHSSAFCVQVMETLGGKYCHVLRWATARLNVSVWLLLDTRREPNPSNWVGPAGDSTPSSCQKDRWPAAHILLNDNDVHVKLDYNVTQSSGISGSGYVSACKELCSLQHRHH